MVPASSRSVRIFALLSSLAVASALAVLPRIQAQGLPPAPGGFLETASSTAVRPLLTAAQVQALLPVRGTFTFPAPYNTTGVRLTNASDCGGGDCVNYVGYSYWRNINNSSGSDVLYAVVGLSRNAGGAGPSLFRYNKITGETVNLGPLFAPSEFLSLSSTEGWYFSATAPTMLYATTFAELRRIDVLTHASSTVFDIQDLMGDDKNIEQAHSSNDDRVHSFTVKLGTTFAPLGCGVYREDTAQFSFFPVINNAQSFDECQIDKSGQWLLIKENISGINEADNRIIDLATGIETDLLDADGAGGHSDNGFGVMITADNRNNLPNAIRAWMFSGPPLAPGPVVYSDPQWIPQSVTHLSFANARSAPLDQQYACGSAANRTNGPRANEVVCFRLDGSRTTLVVAPVMTDLDAGGGGFDDYGKTPKGNLDPTGQYFIWTGNAMDGRLDAFIVRVPSQVLVTPPSDIIAPTVSVTAPAAAATVFGTVALSADAADNVGTAGVQFRLDGSALGAELTAPPYAWNWNTTTTTDGPHVLRAVARDAAGNTTMSLPVNVTVLNTPGPPHISNVRTTAIGGAIATVMWSTDQLADGRIDYGTTTTYGTSTPFVAALTSAHMQTIPGLSPGTVYHYRITSTNAQGVTAESADLTLTTAPPPVISALLVSGIGPQTATISWTTDLFSDTTVAYGPTIAYGLSSSDTGNYVTSHARTLTGLTPGATYHVRVLSMSPAGATAASSDFTLTTPFFIINSVASSSITSSAAVVSWQTSATSSTQVEYGLTTAYGTLTTLASALVTSHSQSLSGLTHSTTYHYRVRSANNAGNLVVSGDFTFTTSPAVIVSGVAVSNVQGASVIISWFTDAPADTQIEYGLSTAYGSLTTRNPTLATGHSQAVNTGLLPGTTYQFRVRSTNGSGLLGTSANLTFTTAPAAVISGVAVASVTDTTAVITWTTDLPSNSRIEYGPTSAYGSTTVLDPAYVTSHSHTITGLTAGTTYVYLVRATTAANALTKLGGFTVTTSSPLVLSSIGAQNIVGLSAQIFWTTNLPADSVVDVGLTTAYGSTTSDASLVSAHFVNLTGLSLSTTYHYRVKSSNGAGMTATSTDRTFTTTQTPVVSNVAATPVVGGSTTITWTTDQATDSQVEYGLTTAYGSTTALDGALVTSHSQTVTGLANGIVYHFRVRSTNGAAVLVISPDATLVPPAPIISNVVISSVQGSTFIATWTTDQPADTQIAIGLTTAYGSLATDPALTTSHSLLFPCCLLSPGTTYHYRLRSQNIGGVLGTSADATITMAAPSVISNVAVANLTPTTATITWNTDLPTDSRIEYGLTSSYGSTTTLDPSFVMAHSQTITGLSQNTTYVYLIRATTAQNVLTKLGGFSFTTTTPAPVVSNVAATWILGTSATITWTTDQPSSSQADYGPTSGYGSTTALDATLVTSHSQTLTGLVPGTAYHFRVRSVNSAAVTGSSADAVVAKAVPVVSGVNVSSIQGASAAISWFTDQPADTQIEYGVTTAYGSTTTLLPALVTGHAQAVNSGLVPGTTYHFRVRSQNADLVIGTSPDLTFTTAPAAVVSAVAASAITGASATITWTTDLAADSRIEYGLTTLYGQTTTLDPALVTSHSQTVTGLTPGTTYFYLVRATTAQNALTKVGGFSFTTPQGAAVSNVVVSSVQGASVAVTWSTTVPADTQIDYGLTTAYGSVTALNTTLSTGHGQAINSGLVPGTTYHFRIRAHDSTGGLFTSGDLTFATAPAAVISGVAVGSMTSTTATITWTTDLPANSRIEYGLTAALGQTTVLDPAYVTSHSHTISGLTQGTTYFYLVRATTAQNALTKVGGFTVTPGGAPVLSLIAASGITGSAATITWTTDVGASSIVEFGPTSAYGSTSSDASLVTAHSRGLTGLANGTTYHYRIQSSNGTGQTATSADFTFTTVAAPVMSAVSAVSVADTAAAIVWTTDQASSSQVEYGTTTAYGSLTAFDSLPVTSHTRSLSGLSIGTPYHYRVLSQNPVGVLAVSGDFTFTTVGAPFMQGVFGEVSGTTATYHWTTSQPATTQIEYGLTTALGTLTTPDPALVTTHQQTLTGLSPGTNYFYRVRGTNSFGLTGESGISVFSVTALPVVSNIVSSSVTETAATISWTTSQPTDARIEYGVTTAYGSSTSLDTSLQSAHAQTLTGLAPATTYHFRVLSANSEGMPATPVDQVFTTATPAAAAISAVTASSVTGVSAAVTWTTDVGASTQIEYGTSIGYGSLTTVDATLVTSHAQSLTGLSVGTLYHYRVRSVTGPGVPAVSDDFTFTTVGLPIVSGEIVIHAGTTITFGWGTNQPATSQVEYGLTSELGSATTLDSALVTIHQQTVTGLTPGATYFYRINGSNSLGLTGYSIIHSFTVTALPVILSGATSGITATSATVSWTVSQPTDARIDYGLTSAYGLTTTLDSVLSTLHTQTLTGLSGGTTYHFKVRSANPEGLEGVSTDQVFTTAPPPPSVTTATMSNIQGASVVVNWFTDQPADTQIQFGVTTAYGSLTPLVTTLVTGHGQAINTGLAPGTTYHFRILARNAGGLLGMSSDMTFTTAPASVISNVAVASVTATTATITWTTDLPTNSRIEYGLTAALGQTTVLDPALVTSHSLTITGLAPGTKYFYLIRATTAQNALTKLGGFTVTTATAVPGS